MNPFIGLSIGELESALRVAQDELLAGRVVVSAGSADVNATEKVERDAEARIRMILKALHKLNPTKYSLENVTPARMTKLVFC